MPHPITVFEKPLAVLVPDEMGVRMYANISNSMDVCVDARPYHVAVAVPTELFTYAKEIARVPSTTIARLAIDRDRDGRDDWYTFSMLADGQLHDLWFYSGGNIPKWILNRMYAVTRA